MGRRDGTADNYVLTSYRCARLSIRRYISFVNYAMRRMRCYLDDSLARLAINCAVKRGVAAVCFGVRSKRREEAYGGTNARVKARLFKSTLHMSTSAPNATPFTHAYTVAAAVEILETHILQIRST
jgi:hypothetical protein